MYYKQIYYMCQGKIKEGSNNISCQIFHSYSHNFDGLQLVDFIVWSIYQKFERNDCSYNDLIKLEQEVYFVW